MDDLDSFFNPKSIALVGASSNPQKVGGVLFHKLKRFKGNFFGINPKYEKLGNVVFYDSLKNLRESVDLAIVATPAETVIEILNQGIKKKIKNFIVISAGFGEVKNFVLERKLLKLIQQHKMNVLGPNCFGVFNPRVELDCTFANSTPKKGNVAFISQSGALWSYVSELGLGFSGFVSLGNMDGLDFVDWIDYFNKDKNTKKIVLYIEKLKDGRKFIEICKKSKKQIIVIKAGKTELGSKATISHTGSLATDFNIYQGAFKQAGVEMFNSVAEAFGKKSEKINLKNQRLKIITNAGGAGAILTDKFIENNNTILQSPKDILGTALAKDYENEIRKIKLKNDEELVVVLTPQAMSEPEKTAEMLSKLKIKNKIVAFFLGDKSTKKAKEILRKAKIRVSGGI